MNSRTLVPRRYGATRSTIPSFEIDMLQVIAVFFHGDPTSDANNPSLQTFVKLANTHKKFVCLSVNLP
jgi:hypothetical protein